MASIPNLSTFRKDKPFRRAIRRDVHAEEEVSPDSVVQQTDGDANSSRLSAVTLGYLQDRYAKEFAASEVQRRYPLINRGTYIRTMAIDRLVSKFLSLPARKQIISLGAGSDTRFFRICQGNVIYHELDFPINIATKKDAIQRSSLLKAREQELKLAGCAYHLHAVDLRELKPDSTIKLDIDPDIPTLVLSECCLCYLSPEEASNTMTYIKHCLNGSTAIVLYEPVRPGDAFGKTMVSNLASRGIQIKTLKRYASLEAQRQRLKLAGFTTCQGARDVYQLWQDWISDPEKERIESLEWLDEVEEWKLLASHYCVAWACQGDDIAQMWSSIDGKATPDELDLDS